jgi:hypothetical protein
MQLAVNVQIPSCFGGLDGSAVYIGGWVVELRYINRVVLGDCWQPSGLADQSTLSF